MDGTRAVTLMVAFDAGSRTERAEENGMAHFLEHLVFKGGEKYKTYRDVNEAAERNGAVLNAYTSHDLVAFHITARSTKALEAADLLTDFVGRPALDPAELDKERGVVVQEIARYNDQPAAVAEHLIDEAVFGDHPLGRSVLGPAEHLAETFTRDGIIAFRHRRWSPSRGAALAVGNLEALGSDSELDELFERFESTDRARRLRAGASADGPRAGHRARLQSVASAHVLPPLDRRHGSRRACRAHYLLDAARRLDGVTPLRRDPRAARIVLFGELLPACLRRRPRAAVELRPREWQVCRGLPADGRDRQ